MGKCGEGLRGGVEVCGLVARCFLVEIVTNPSPVSPEGGEANTLLKRSISLENQLAHHSRKEIVTMPSPFRRGANRPAD